MAAQDAYSDLLKVFRRCHNEKEVLTKLMDQLHMRSSTLNTATTCLSVGTGVGDYDIEFIQRCLPNLKKLIVVEKDGHSVKELRENLKNSKINSNEDIEIYEMSIENFIQWYDEEDDDCCDISTLQKNVKQLKKLVNKKIDVVLALHVIYLLNKQNRQKFYEMCFNSWLKPGVGQLIFANVNENHSAKVLFDKFNPHSFISSQIIINELKSNGISTVKVINYKCPLDMEQDDMKLRKFYKFTVGNSNVDDASISNVLKAIAPDGWATHDCDLCICQKAN